MEQFKYMGMDLKDFCKKYNIQYDYVLAQVERLKNTGIYLGYSDDDLVKEVMEKEVMVKYKVFGISLYQYCKNNGVSYPAMVSKINRLMQNDRYKDLDIKSLVELAMGDDAISRHTVYIYKGISLKNYCDKYGISYRTIIDRIKTLKGDKQYGSLPIDTIVSLAMDDNYLSYRIYQYNGISLHQYCKDNNIAYSTIANRVRKLRKEEKYKDYRTEDIIKIIIESRSYRKKD